jgi:hypothetical protein
MRLRSVIMTRVSSVNSMSSTSFCFNPTYLVLDSALQSTSMSLDRAWSRQFRVSFFVHQGWCVSLSNDIFSLPLLIWHILASTEGGGGQFQSRFKAWGFDTNIARDLKDRMSVRTQGSLLKVDYRWIICMVVLLGWIIDVTFVEWRIEIFPLWTFFDRHPTMVQGNV